MQHDPANFRIIFIKIDEISAIVFNIIALVLIKTSKNESDIIKGV